MVGWQTVQCSLEVGDILNNKYLISDDIVFNSKPDAVPYNYRVSYKIGQLCLIISMCCGRGGCSIFKLHMISMALYTKDAMKSLIDFCENRLSSYTLIRFDPAVNRAVKYALGDALIFQQANGLFRLTEKGKLFADLIKKDKDTLVNEKAFFGDLSNKLTEDSIKELMNVWRYSDAPNK